MMMQSCVSQSGLTAAQRSPANANSQQPLLLHPSRSFARMFHPPPSVPACRGAVRMAAVSSSAAGSAPKMAPSGFQPTIWGDFFVRYTRPMQKSEKWMEGRAIQLKEEVSELFGACKDVVVEQMNLVNVLQRLGIDHHFEEEIAKVLSSIHGCEFDSSSLHEVSLRFLLLRQQGYWVSPDVFNKFRCEDGSFMVGLTSDPKGLLSLYNAANLLIHDEGVLAEAISFTRHHLESMRNNLKSPLAGQVARALEIPLPRTLKRAEALAYISEYSIEEEQDYYNPSILELAKLDFNILQNLHQKELKDICRWWEDVSRDIGLDYIRDRVVECYFASYNVYYEQEHARARMVLTKLFMLMTVLDDTYDVRATLEECRKLTEAIHRWDDGAVSLLPEYLKKFFLSMMENFREIENELEPHEKYRNTYSREAGTPNPDQEVYSNLNIEGAGSPIKFQILSSCYLQESEWFHQDYIPTFEQKVDVSAVTAGGLVQFVSLLVGMGDVATKEAFEWAIGYPDASKAYGEVTRFMDDLGAFKNGKDKMDVASSVECYMKEHNVTSEVAMAKISSLVEDGWRTVNEARFKHRALLPVVERFTNLMKLTALLCHDMKDGYTNSEDFKDIFESHLVNPIPF